MNFTINKDEFNFKHVWRIKNIDVNVVTFTKYTLSPPVDSLEDSNKIVVSLDKTFGSETHKVTPAMQLELCGKVGTLLKEFKAKKFNTTVKIEKIEWL